MLLTIKIHSMPPDSKDDGQDEEQDANKEEDVVPYENSVSIEGSEFSLLSRKSCRFGKEIRRKWC